MIGGAGNDTYVVDNAGDVVTENASEGTDTVQSSITYTLGANLENLTLTGTGSINATGNALANVLTGNAGNNVLDGGAGADTMAGGAGNDTYMVDDSGDVIVESAGSGTDTVVASASYVLSANIETLTLAGSASIDGTGNAQANTINGNAGNNVLTGGGGNDTLFGGLGTDVYMFARGDGSDSVYDDYRYQQSYQYQVYGIVGYDGEGNAQYGYTTATGTQAVQGDAGADTLQFGTGISAGDLAISASGNDLIVGIKDPANPNATFAQLTDKIVLKDWLIAANRIETFKFADGSTLAAAGIVGMIGTDGADSFTWTESAVNLSLGAGNDAFTTGAFDDTLDGGTGADTLAGGAGNDTYIVDNAGDFIVEAAGAGTDTVQASASYTLAANVENLTLTGTGSINATGNASANVLTGNAGDNVLDGGAGADTMIGGAGNDTYIVDNAGDVVTENANEGTDTVQSSIAYTLGANLENLTLTGTGSINGTGNALANVLTGNSGNNVLDGGTGADTMIGGAGNDTYFVDDAGDMVTENASEGTDTVQASISYTLGANVENLTLTGTGSIGGIGNALANTLTGNAGDNTLDGGAGADTMVGGAGNDTYVVDNAGDVVTENASEGTDTIQASVTYALGSNVENLTLTGAGSINATGNTLANVLTGNAGDNVLDGGAGADTMVGGTGNDTYVVDNAGDVVTENANEGADTVQASIAYTLGANLENLTLTGTGSINGTGNTLANVLTGNSGDNVLDGGSGADTMAGGTGNDTYVVDNAGDVVTENANEGTDTIQSSIAYTLGANLENLTLTGTGSINGTGNASANVLTGNSGDNVLDGGAGADTMIGGTGNDTYVVDNTGDVVTENASEGTDTVQASFTYTLGSNVENLVLTGTAAINGTGNALANALTGNSGDNILDGGAGADTMTGGAGNDIYVVDNAGDVIVEAASAGTDTVQASVTYTLAANAENLTLTGTSSVNGTGNTLANVLVGNAGDNVLDGGAGNDTLTGGSGADTYVFGIGSGSDTVNAYHTDAGVDKIQFGSGIAASDVTFVKSGNDLTVTLAGASDQLTIKDWFSGSAYQVGSFVLSTGASVPLVVSVLGTSGADSLTGTSGDDKLVGLAGADTLSGGDGNDTMAGGTGNDTLYGGLGNDVYTFNRGDGTDQVYDDYRYQQQYSYQQYGVVGYDGEGAPIYGYTTAYGTQTVQGDAGTDILDFGTGVSASDLTIGVSGNDLIVGVKDPANPSATFAQLTDKVTLKDWMITANRIETFRFADGSTLSLAGIIARIGTDGADTFTWTETAATIDGGAGNDSLTGGTYADSLSGGDGNDTIRGAAGNDTLIGGNGADMLYGDAGDDRLDGGAGNDTLEGGAGADTYIFGIGSGSDTINAYHTDSATDLVKFGSGIAASDITFAKSGNDLVVTLAGASDQLTLKDWFSGSAYQVGTFQLSNGANVPVVVSVLGTSAADSLTGTASAERMVGLAGNDTLTALAGDDTMVGGAGNDTLYGGLGNDVYTFGRTDGVDLVYDDARHSETYSYQQYGVVGYDGEGAPIYGYTTAYGTQTVQDNAGADTLQFGSGISASDLIFSFSSADLNVGVRDAGNTTATMSQVTDKATLKDWTNTLNKIETIKFANNVSIDIGATSWQTGSSSAETLTGGTGNDWLIGEAGADSLVGGNGNDVLNGGTGNDTLNGGSGSDTYLMDRGFGSDLIRSAASDYASTEDKLVFGSSVARNQLWFTRSGNDLSVSIIGTTDAAKVENWFTDSTGQLDKIVSGDGYALLNGQVQQLVDAMAALSPPAQGQTTLDATQSAALDSVIAANWQSN